MKKLCNINQIQNIWSTSRGLITIELLDKSEIETHDELYFHNGAVYEKDVARKVTKELLSTL
jgi:hypothetical protein